MEGGLREAEEERGRQTEEESTTAAPGPGDFKGTLSGLKGCARRMLSELFPNTDIQTCSAHKKTIDFLRKIP